jgi:hypothetical protein
MYIYKRTEFSPYELYTVGTYDSGEWESESDHPSIESAEKRVHYLNGGTDEKLLSRIAELEEALKSVVGVLIDPHNDHFYRGFRPLIDKDDQQIIEKAKQLLNK